MNDTAPPHNTASIAAPRHRPGDQVLFRNGRTILMGTVSYIEAIPCTGTGRPITEADLELDKTVWIWSYGIAGYGQGFLERQLTKVPPVGKLRTIGWVVKGVGITPEEWPSPLNFAAPKTTDPAQPGSPI